MKTYENLSNEQLIEILQHQDKVLKEVKFGLSWDKEREKERVVVDCEKNLPILETNLKKDIYVNESTENILIQGDNFHSLSVLNYTHENCIDMIYIDPPYNTLSQGFVYNDKLIDINDGYRHSKWLNQIEKRLLLARNLLKDSGTIFISIDDNEFAQLKLLCDSVFSEKNFIACLPTVMNLKGNQDEFAFAGTHEYTLVYSKNKSSALFNQFNLIDEELESWIEDEKGFYKKGATLKSTGADAPREKRPKMFYPILVKSNSAYAITVEEYKKIYVDGIFDDEYLDNLVKKYKQQEYDVVLPYDRDGGYARWRWGFDTLSKKTDEIIVTRPRNSVSLYKKQRPTIGDMPTKKPKTLFYKPEYSSGNGTSQLFEFFGKKVFDNPKPLQLIKDFIQIGANKDNSIILDFYAGSGTTGQAILDLNNEDEGSRRFILCTNNENNICDEVTYPRLSKIIKGYKSNSGKDVLGVDANLKFFKTGFVKKTRNRDQMKIDITNKCTELLCLKRNSFTLVKKDDNYEHFKTVNSSSNTFIFYDFIYDYNDFERFVNYVNSIKGQKYIYIFSFDNIIDTSLFVKDDECHFEPIPEKILDIYNSLEILVREK
jgi:adenine-specific DNA-methyltransferase